MDTVELLSILYIFLDTLVIASSTFTLNPMLLIVDLDLLGVSSPQSCFGRNLVIDPTSEEEACQDGTLMITCMPARNEVTQLMLTGEWTTAKSNEVSICLEGEKVVLNYFNQINTLSCPINRQWSFVLMPALSLLRS